MSAEYEMLKLGMKHVKPWTYPDTYAVIKTASLMAQQSTNRDSASWKKAEYIIVDELYSDFGEELLPAWLYFTAADPAGSASIQKLVIYIGGGQYAMYDAQGVGPRVGKIKDLVK